MVTVASTLQVARAIASNPAIVKAKPSVNWYLCQYLRKFKVIDVAGKLIVHSHLPPINSLAYKRFIREHLLAGSIKPSHAQIGITNACPQHCDYCYNKGRSGALLRLEEILQLVRDLKNLGVFWMGLTGGEPLLNKDLVAIVEAIGSDCSSKLFTTGCGLTSDLARDLRDAGLTYVTVSLDHWDEAVHDRARNYKGAYKAAIRAIETFLALSDLHVGVSAVLSRDILQENGVERFLEFLQGLGIHEAWLSETKPSVEAYWKKDLLLTDDERTSIVNLQDAWNKRGGMTVNYLSHFESAQHFGCTAGHKMVYVDAFGEVSPCVFIPMTLGNVRDHSIGEIVGKMLARFPGENTCFINKNYEIVRKHSRGNGLLAKEEVDKVLGEIEFAERSRFFALQYR